MRCVNIPEIYDEYDESDEFKRQKEKEYNEIQKELENEKEIKTDKNNTEQEIRNYIISGNSNQSDTMDAKERNFIIHGKEAPKQFGANVKNENKLEPTEKPKNKNEIKNQNKNTSEDINFERPKPSVESAKEILTEKLDEIFGNNPYTIDPSKVPSLRELSRMSGLSRRTISLYLEENYLTKFNNPKLLYRKLWSYPGADTETKKELLFEILDDQLKMYPQQKVSSRNDLVRMIGRMVGKTTKISVSKWIHEYLKNKIIEENNNYDIKFAESLSKKLYSEIWQAPQKNPIKHEDLESFVGAKGGRLITSEIQFNGMTELSPVHRNIEIKCESGHNFTARVNNLLYRHDWCPKCNVHFCQKITNLYLQKVMQHLSAEKTEIKEQITLGGVFGIPLDKGGRLKYDNLARNIRLSGKDENNKNGEIVGNIATEYDGIQHDKFPNPYHKTRDQYNIQRKNDNLKDDISVDHKTFIIRLKALHGFDHTKINDFQAEIIRQLQNRTGLKFNPMPHFIYDKWTDTLMKDPAGKVIDVPLDPGAPFTKPWVYGAMDFFLHDKNPRKH